MDDDKHSRTGQQPRNAFLEGIRYWTKYPILAAIFAADFFRLSEKLNFATLTMEDQKFLTDRVTIVMNLSGCSFLLRMTLTSP